MFQHSFGIAGTRTVRMHVGAVTVNVDDGEFLHYKLTVQGAIPVFDFACKDRTLFDAKDFPGHPKQIYEWDLGKSPNKLDSNDDVYVVGMFFVGNALKYTLLVEHRLKDNTVKEVAIDADYTSQNSEDKFREILSVFTS